MNTISISQEELKHVRFPSNQSVIVGDKLLKYSSSILMMDELRNLAFSTRGCSEPIPEYPLHSAKQVEKIDRNSFEASTKL